MCVSKWETSENLGESGQTLQIRGICLTVRISPKPSMACTESVSHCIGYARVSIRDKAVSLYRRSRRGRGKSKKQEKYAAGRCEKSNCCVCGRFRLQESSAEKGDGRTCKEVDEKAGLQGKASCAVGGLPGSKSGSRKEMAYIPGRTWAGTSAVWHEYGNILEAGADGSALALTGHRHVPVGVVKSLAACLVCRLT